MSWNKSCWFVESLVFRDFLWLFQGGGVSTNRHRGGSSVLSFLFPDHPTPGAFSILLWQRTHHCVWPMGKLPSLVVPFRDSFSDVFFVVFLSRSLCPGKGSWRVIYASGITQTSVNLHFYSSQSKEFSTLLTEVSWEHGYLFQPVPSLRYTYLSRSLKKLFEEVL